MKKEKKQLKVSAIKDGTVIDHIPAKNLFKVISILGLDCVDSMITFGTNLESKQHGLKGIIKISGLFFQDEDINKIALVAPNAKLNIIKDYTVVEKKQVSVPREINGIVKCVNPMCITNHDDVQARFTPVNSDKVALKCSYCERITDEETMVIK